MLDMRQVGVRLVLFAFIAVGAVVHAFAGELTVDTYCALSVARLERAVSALEIEGRALTAQDESALWASHGTTRDAFYEYAGAHREDVQAYLTSHAELQKTIDILSNRLHELVGQIDAAQTASDDAGPR